MQKFLNSIYILIGFIIVSLLLFRRLYLRLPRELPQEIGVYTLSIYIIIIFSLLYMIIRGMFKLRAQYKKKITPKNKLIVKIKDFFLNKIIPLMEHKLNPFNIINSSLIQFNDFIEPRIPFIGRSYQIIGDFLSAFKLSYTQPLLLLIIFDFIPKLFVTCSLVIDTFILQEFHYLYMSVWLLLLPACLHILINRLTFFAFANINIIDDILDIYIIKDPNEKPLEYLGKISTLEYAEITEALHIGETLHCCTVLKPAFIAQFDPKEIHIENTLNMHVDGLQVFYHIRAYVLYFYGEEEKYALIFSIIRCMIYLICWTYILWYGL